MPVPDLPPDPVATGQGRAESRDSCWDRRRFLRSSGGCAAHLALVSQLAPFAASPLFAATRERRVIQEVPWGRLEEVADGVWAMVSTPLQDRTTLCNGGIVRGRAGVLMVEAFGSTDGAVWMARQARALTGRWPDQVVLTHYHGDHTAGLAGVAAEGEPLVRATAATRELTRNTARGAQDDALMDALARVSVLPGLGPTTLDLGDRRVEVVPLEGHTASDVTVEVLDPAVLFCGDLVWNRFFPNYVDAVPSLLGPAVATLRRSGEAVWVPGHGPVADAGDLELCIDLLEVVERHARDAHARGMSASEAAAEFTLPPALESWYRFSDRYPERALGAWLAELTAG